MSHWNRLDEELAQWADAGLTASLWWRDDDAAAPCPELERLTSLSAACHVPVGLAVIPGRATPELAGFLKGFDHLEIMQHGFAHHNHAEAGAKKNEFPDTRERKAVLADLMSGRRLLSELGLGAQVLVPPWNRFDQRLLPVLPGLGLRGISTFGPRERANAVPALAQVNTHVDPVNWRGDRLFLGEAPVLAQLIAHLAARRLGEVDAEEPTGLLSHHLDHDDAGWDFIARLLDLTGGHSCVKWLGVGEAFGFR